jgi:hypothetical protein
MWRQQSWFKTFKSFNRFAPFNSPTSFLPRVAGEDEGGGLNDLNFWNALNCSGLDPFPPEADQPQAETRFVTEGLLLAHRVGRLRNRRHRLFASAVHSLRGRQDPKKVFHRSIQLAPYYFYACR